MSASPGHRLLPGSVVGGDFTVVRSLDEGGMGAVYVVGQGSTGKLRALKVMHREIVADPGLERRFEQESRVGARIASDHVVEVIASGFDADIASPYLVMELLEGETLRRRMETRGAMSAPEVRAIFEQLGHAMGAAHAAGVVHRDLKPDNIFLATSRRAGATPFTLKVLDFGIAKLLAEVRTHATHGTLGSPLWMAPEQTAAGDIAPAADVWALGLIAYHLFTGSYYWRASKGGISVALLREIVFDPLVPASERARESMVAERLPAGFDAWFARCVVRDVGARFPDAASMWHAMQSLFGTAPPVMVGSTLDARSVVMAAPPLHAETPIVSAQPVPQTQASPRNAGRLALVGGIAVALAGLGGGWLLAHRSPEPVPLTVASASAPGPATQVPLPPPAVSSGIAAPSASVAAMARTPSRTATSPSSSSPKKKVPNGYGDPVDRKSAVLWKVQDHQVRLFTRMIANESNVVDAEVRDAVEHSSWQYLRCYEQVFRGAKDLPEGTVTVSFEILDQLPRLGKLASSTFESQAFGQCVLDTLTGQTINAAGPNGRGHVTYGFRFVPMN